LKRWIPIAAIALAGCLDTSGLTGGKPHDGATPDDGGGLDLARPVDGSAFDSAIRDAGNADLATPTGPALQGALSGGGVLGSAGGYSLNGHFTWHAIAGSAGGYTLRGWTK
jgi:hypothetical protein